LLLEKYQIENNLSIVHLYQICIFYMCRKTSYIKNNESFSSNDTWIGAKKIKIKAYDLS